MDLLKRSRFFWLVLRALCTSSTYSALAYNGFLMALSEASLEVLQKKPMGLRYALSHSRMRTLPPSAYSLLKEVLETISYDGTLTGSQEILAQMALQKLG